MLAHIRPSHIWFTCRTRPIFNGYSYPGSESWAGRPAKCPEPLCPQQALPHCGMVSRTTSEGIIPPSLLIRTHAPDQNPPADFSCPSCGGSLSRRAGLGDGPSRHYLCNPCAGAWTPTPQCSPGALARFFPGDNGLTSDVTGSAHQTLPVMQLQQGKVFRGCSHSFMFRLPRSLDPQVAPTAEVLSLQGGRAVYTTHSSVGYLPRDVASLRIRHEQLIRLDFHHLDCSLVGCSDVHK